MWQTDGQMDKQIAILVSHMCDNRKEWKQKKTNKLLQQMASAFDNTGYTEKFTAHMAG